MPTVKNRPKAAVMENGRSDPADPGFLCGGSEMSGKPILHARLEAIPFARFTVECQSQLEKQNKASRVRQSVTSLFGLTDEEGEEGGEEAEPKTDDSKE